MPEPIRATHSNQTLVLMRAKEHLVGDEVIPGYKNWIRILELPELRAANSAESKRAGTLDPRTMVFDPITIEMAAEKASILAFTAMATGSCLGLLEIVSLFSVGGERKVHKKYEFNHPYVVDWEIFAAREGRLCRVSFVYGGMTCKRTMYDQDFKSIGHISAGQSEEREKLVR